MEGVDRGEPLVGKSWGRRGAILSQGGVRMQTYFRI